jgi:large subunit ribosomal protein L31e
MAETKKLERTYVIPLRRKTVKIQRYLRAKKAMSVIRKFMKRHMKSENIKLGQELNELVWSRGGAYVPGKVHVTAIKEDDIVHVNLVGVKPKTEEKKVEKKVEKKEEKKEEHKEAPKEEKHKKEHKGE